MADLERPILALLGHLLDQDDPEMVALETAQRWFEKKVGQSASGDREVGLALLWLAGCRLQLHNMKGAHHTLGHLRARFRGRFPDLEMVASFLEVRMQYEMGDFRNGSNMLDRIPKINLSDPRIVARLEAIRLHMRGDFLSGMSQLKVAQDLYLKAFEALRHGPAQLEDLAITAELYNSQGMTFFREGRADEALKAYSNAETVCKHIGFKLAEARCYKGRGMLYLAKKQFQEGIAELKHAMELYQSCGAPYGILRTGLALGQAHYRLTDYRQALLYYEEAKIQCGTGSFTREEGEVCARIGDILLAEGQYEKAAEYYEQDLQLATNNQDQRARAYGLFNVGRIQRLLGNYMRAEACLEEACALFHGANDKGGLCSALLQRVQCFAEQGKATQSRSCLEQLKETAQRLGRPFEIGLAEMLEGVVLRHEGQAEAARKQLEKSLRVLGQEPGFYTVWCTMELAQALEDAGHRSSAVSRFKEAIQFGRQLRLADLEKRALDMLGQVDRSEWAKALHGAGASAPIKRRNAGRVFISVLLVELRHLTQFGSSHEADETATVANRFFEQMATVIVDQKGILNKVMGERMMAVFGLGNPCDPAQALSCANECLNEFWKLLKEDGALADLNIACAIATGEALEGMLGPRDRLEYTVLGRPISLVQRLIGQADGGDILICSDTFRAVGHQVSHPVARDVMARTNEQKLVAYQVASSRPPLAAQRKS